MSNSIFVQLGVETQKFSEEAFQYIKKQSKEIINISKIVGVSSGAVAGALLEENDSYNKESVKKILDDIIELGLAGNLATKYEDWVYKEATGDYGLIKKSNPVFWDIGPANIQIGTAVSIIQRTPNELLEKLDLVKHKNISSKGIQKLSEDLILDKDNISAKIYALYIKEAERFFIDNKAYGNDWEKLPQEYKDSLYITYVNFGENKIKSIRDARAKPGKYEPMPGLTTGAGIDHLFHAKKISNVLGLNNYGKI